MGAGSRNTALVTPRAADRPFGRLCPTGCDGRPHRFPAQMPLKSGINQGDLLESLFYEAGLASDDLRVCKRAAENLRLAVADNKRAQNAAREAGVMPLLSRLLQPETTDDDTVRAACVAIYTLAHRNPGCQDAGGTAGIVSRLLVLLGGGAGALHEQTLIDACTALGILCLGHYANQATAYRVGGVEILVAIAAYSRFEEGRMRACFTLGCLAAANPALRSSIIQAGGVRAAVALLPPHAPREYHDDARTRKRLHALSALRDLVLGHQEAQLDALAAGAFEQLVALIRDRQGPNCHEIAGSACDTIAAVLAGRAQSQFDLRCGGGILILKEVIEQVPRETPREVDLCVAACRAIETLACGDPGCQSAARSTDTLEELLKLVDPLSKHSSPRELIGAAFGAINSVMGGHAENIKVVLSKRVDRKSTSGVDSMFSAISRFTDDCPGSVFGTLSVLAEEDPRVRETVRTRVRDPTGRVLNPIKTLLERLNDRVAQSAAEDASGLRWRKIGKVRPVKGRQLRSERLSELLTWRTPKKLTQSEWDRFGISGLTTDHFIKCGEIFYKPRAYDDDDDDVDDSPELPIEVPHPPPAVASGLKWRQFGKIRPNKGKELDSEDLQEALKEGSTFSQAKWDSFGILNLSIDDFVQSGDMYYLPRAARDDEPSCDSDSPLSALANFWENRELSASRRETKEAAVGILTLIGSLAGHKTNVSPLSEFDVAPLVNAMSLGADASHAAMSCALQLYHAGAMTPECLVQAMRLEDDRGADAVVSRLTPPSQGSVGESSSPPASKEELELVQTAAALVIAMAPAEGAVELLFGAVQPLVRALRTEASRSTALRGDDVSITQMVAFRAVLNCKTTNWKKELETKNYKRAQDAAREAGAAESLADLLKLDMDSPLRDPALADRNARVTQCALGAIAAFCAQNPANRKAMRCSGDGYTLKRVVDLLSPDQPDGCAAHAAVALVHLAAQNASLYFDEEARESRMQIEEYGGLNALAALWAHHGYDGPAGLNSPVATAAERGLYELALGGFEDHVAKAKRAARMGKLKWHEGPEQWAKVLHEMDPPRAGDVKVHVGDFYLEYDPTMFPDPEDGGLHDNFVSCRTRADVEVWRTPRDVGELPC